jgi:hypothetical protein
MTSTIHEVAGKGLETFYYKLIYIVPQGERDTVSPVLKYYAVQMYWGVEIKLHAFLTLALDGGDCSASLHSPPFCFILFFYVLTKLSLFTLVAVTCQDRGERSLRADIMTS